MVFIHPLIFLLISNTTYTLAGAYTSRNSPLRYAALGILIICAVVFPVRLHEFAHTTGWFGRIAAGSVTWNCFSYTNYLLIMGWDYYHYGPVTEPKSTMNGSAKKEKSEEDRPHFPGTRMEFGSEIPGNARRIGLFHQVKDVPLFDDLRPDFVPSRTAFILKNSVIVFLCWALHEATINSLLTLDRSLLAQEYIPFFARLSEVTLEQFYVRAFASLGYWVWNYCQLQGLYSFFSILGVLGDAKNTKLWPPQFGVISDAYTLRGFWGKFWHQNLRLVIEGLSAFFADDVLHLPKKGKLPRYSKLFFSFFVSGAMHVASDTGGGLAVRDSGALTFFTVQALGIMIEDGVQHIYKQYLKESLGSYGYYFERIVGFAWVLFFLTWSSPIWVFVAEREMRLDDARFTWSAIKPAFVGRSA